MDISTATMDYGDVLERLTLLIFSRTIITYQSLEYNHNLIHTKKAEVHASISCREKALDGRKLVTAHSIAIDGH